MRSRRKLLLLLGPAAVLTAVLGACGGGGSGADQTTAAPTTTVGPGPQLTTTPTSALTSAPAPTTRAPTVLDPTTLAPTTAAPTTPPQTPLAPTSTRQVVTLPTGVSEADRLAAEAAAIGWWEEVQRQTKALPEFDPQAILALTIPGRPAGPAMVGTLERRRKEGFALRTGTVDQTVLLGTRFLSRDLVEVQVCLADDNVFIQQTTGVEELGGLGRSFYLSLLRRTASAWKVEDWGSFRDSEDGVACE